MLSSLRLACQRPRALGARAMVTRSPVCLADEKREGNRSQVHFRASTNKHPLLTPGSKLGFAQNHIWAKEEIDEKLETLYMHKPVTISDRIVHGFMRTLYHSFNFVTGYKKVNTPVKAIEWRLIVLESFAGVPGFMAAGFRHFRSLRTLERDHGWIHTLLEEAENERMHLLVCLNMFNANWVTRSLVVTAQFTMTPILMAVYMFKPKAVHRFVGYLEETACETYASIIHQIETPGTPLNEAWKDTPAPDIAKGYWRLDDDALFLETLRCMFADETNHRDVNHTFATMESDDPNPFLEKHVDDAASAWRKEFEPKTVKSREQ